MSGDKRHRCCKFWLDIFSCFVIPAYTLLFAGEKEWFRTNFSVLAIKGETYYFGFLLWGLTVGGYFLLCMVSLTGKLADKALGRLLYSLIAAACSCLVYGLAIPYLPLLSPRYARLHVGLVFGSCILMMAVLLLVLLAGWRAEKRKYRSLLLCWSGIAGGSMFLLLLCGKVSSGLEVFFTLSAVLLVRSTWIRQMIK